MTTPLPMTGERPDRCETCWFWNSQATCVVGESFEPDSDGTPMGQCRVIGPAYDSKFPGKGQWPYTRRDDWCGEFRPRSRFDPPPVLRFDPTPEQRAELERLLAEMKGQPLTYLPNPPTEVYPDSAVAAAVLAERERCARVAESWRELPSVQDDHDATGCMAAFSEGQECTAPAGIAAAIREGR
jgi:hypothetical protein